MRLQLQPDVSQPSLGEGRKVLTRRSFLHRTGLLAASVALAQVADQLSHYVGASPAEAQSIDLVHDTMNGLIAFVVPGPDPYSVAQGVSTPEPGGMDANITEVLITTLDTVAPFIPHFSATIAGTLNGIAQQVNPGAVGNFPSHFARLLFAQKAQVFAIMESLEPLKPVAGLLLILAASLPYTEAGVFDPVTRQLTGQPIGWTLSHYDGVAEGRDDFKGYFQNRRRAVGHRERDDD